MVPAFFRFTQSFRCPALFQRSEFVSFRLSLPHNLAEA